MPDIIHLLPDSVANQIAAGEVIQRPASVVKELLENAVDSGADEIKLIIKDSGKNLVQVVDNGCGMSETDARLSFERHATSKITSANDLFAIKTLGFRGEALASMAAIAQIEMKTKRMEDDVGSCILIEGSQVKNQAPCACQNGTSMALKNLFFNIPARRKFLKSNSTELRHIIEEFQRVSLVNPEISFSFFNENRQLFMLPKSNLKQRIVSLFGSAFNNRLVPIEQESDVVKISGFIGKPEFSRKTRGEQYFFVNGRFIRHPYLNHAVDNAFKELIPSDAFPVYFIYFKIDPKDIDINIHPTKTEVNFQNNQVIYAFLSSAIKQSLGKFNVVQSIDFNVEPSVEFRMTDKNKPINPPDIKVDTSYNPFDLSKVQHTSGTTPKKHIQNWEKLYEHDTDLSLKKDEKQITSQVGQEKVIAENEKNMTESLNLVFQLQGRYIISSIKSGLMLIDQKRAHERILFEEFMNCLDSGKGMSQQQLFPETTEFSAGDAEIVRSLQEDLKILGFDIEEFGDNTFIINGVPADLNNRAPGDVLESIIENFKKNISNIHSDKKVNLARSMAVKLATGYGTKLEREEMNSLIDRLFGCKVPDVSPDGKPIVKVITMQELDQIF